MNCALLKRGHLICKTFGLMLLWLTFPYWFCPNLTSTVGGFGAGFFLACKDFGRMLDNFRLEQQENFLLQGQLCVLTLIQRPFHPLIDTVTHKDPSHSAKSAGGRLHLNTHTPLTHQSRSGLTMPLSRHSVGTYQETGSHATHQRTLGHSRLSSLSHCGLILA